MTTRTAFPLAAAVLLAACVHGDPVAPIEAPAVATYVSEAGDSLLLLGDGTFKARPAEGIGPPVTVAGVPVVWWAHGVYDRSGASICARPNYLAADALECGAIVLPDGTIDDPGGIFLWDGIARRWRGRG